MTLFSQVATVRTASMPSTRCWTSTARLAALTRARPRREARDEAAGRPLGARRLGLFGAGGVDTPRLAPDRRQALDGRRHGLDVGRRRAAAAAHQGDPAPGGARGGE